MITASRAEATGRSSRCRLGPGPRSKLAQHVWRTSASKWLVDRLPILFPAPAPCTQCPEQAGPTPTMLQPPHHQAERSPLLAGPPVHSSYTWASQEQGLGPTDGGGVRWGLKGQADGDAKPYYHPEERDPSQDGEGEEASSWVGS